MQQEVFVADDAVPVVRPVLSMHARVTVDAPRLLLAQGDHGGGWSEHGPTPVQARITVVCTMLPLRRVAGSGGMELIVPSNGGRRRQQHL